MRTQVSKQIKLQPSTTIGASAKNLVLSFSNSDKNCNPYNEPCFCITLQDSENKSIGFVLLSPEEAEYITKGLQALLKAQRITEDPNTINDQSDVLI